MNTSYVPEETLYLKRESSRSVCSVARIASIFPKRNLLRFILLILLIAGQLTFVSLWHAQMKEYVFGATIVIIVFRLLELATYIHCLIFEDFRYNFLYMPMALVLELLPIAVLTGCNAQNCLQI